MRPGPSNVEAEQQPEDSVAEGSIDDGTLVTAAFYLSRAGHKHGLQGRQHAALAAKSAFGKVLERSEALQAAGKNHKKVQEELQDQNLELAHRSSQRLTFQCVVLPQAPHLKESA